MYRYIIYRAIHRIYSPSYFHSVINLLKFLNILKLFKEHIVIQFLSFVLRF